MQSNNSRKAQGLRASSRPQMATNNGPSAGVGETGSQPPSDVPMQTQDPLMSQEYIRHYVQDGEKETQQERKRLAL